MVLSCRNGYDCLGKTSDLAFSSARSRLEQVSGGGMCTCTHLCTQPSQRRHKKFIAGFHLYLGDDSPSGAPGSHSTVPCMPKCSTASAQYSCCSHL